MSQKRTKSVLHWPPKQGCRYCRSFDKDSREHVIPKAIGGRPRVKGVCQHCNNTVLSELDNELITRSPISVIAAEKLPKSHFYFWDIDQTQNRLLIEATMRREDRSVQHLSQLIFDGGKKHLRCSIDDLELLGASGVRDRFVYPVLDAFRAHERGEKRRLHFDRVPYLPEVYRLPPRVFARTMIGCFKERHSFILRYRDEHDKRSALAALESWSPAREFRNARSQLDLASRQPSIQLIFRPEYVLRALLKIGVNLLAYCCEGTQVTCDTFPETFNLILGNRSPNRQDFNLTGFIEPPGEKYSFAAPDSHAFRLSRTGNRWLIQAAFFEGAVCATCTIDGPSKENWRTAELVFPYVAGKPDRISKYSLQISTFEYSTVYDRCELIIPSANIANPRSALLALKRKGFD